MAVLEEGSGLHNILSSTGFRQNSCIFVTGGNDRLKMVNTSEAAIRASAARVGISPRRRRFDTLQRMTGMWNSPASVLQWLLSEFGRGQPPTWDVLLIRFGQFLPQLLTAGLSAEHPLPLRAHSSNAGSKHIRRRRKQARLIAVIGFRDSDNATVFTFPDIRSECSTPQHTKA